MHSGLRGEAHRDETGTGSARSGLHRSDGLALHTRGAAQSGPYDEWLSLRVRSYGTATLWVRVQPVAHVLHTRSTGQSPTQTRPHRWRAPTGSCGGLLRAPRFKSWPGLNRHAVWSSRMGAPPDPPVSLGLPG